MSLSTGKLVNRATNRITILPVTDDVIRRVEALAHREDFRALRFKSGFNEQTDLTDPEDEIEDAQLAGVDDDNIDNNNNNDDEPDLGQLELDDEMRVETAGVDDDDDDDDDEENDDEENNEADLSQPQDENENEEDEEKDDDEVVEFSGDDDEDGIKAINEALSFGHSDYESEDNDNVNGVALFCQKH